MEYGQKEMEVNRKEKDGQKKFREKIKNRPCYLIGT
jgi:hypothetical protein